MTTNIEQTIINVIKKNPDLFQRQIFDIVKDKCNISEYFMINKAERMIAKGLIKKYDKPERFRHTFYEVNNEGSI